MIDKYFTEDKVKQLTLEANEKGCTIREFINADKITYTRTLCGHNFTCNPSNVRHQKRTLCRECNDLRFDEIVKEKQVQVVEKINTYTFKIVVNKCKHEITTSIHNLGKTNGPLKCWVCSEEDFKKRCEIVGVDVLENPVNIEEVKHLSHPSKYAKFVRKSCGHTFICLRHDIERFTRCRICTQEEKEKKLIANGYELVSKTDSNVKSIYRFSKCGHERILFDSAALRGNAVCHVCNTTSNTLKSKLYIIQFRTNSGFEFIKFGYGKHILNRVREYSLKDTDFIGILFEMDIETGNKARIIENSIHKSLNDFKLLNEQMKVFLTRTGYSECYPTCLLEEIKLRIHNECSSY